MTKIINSGSYTAILHKDEDSAWGIYFPDIKGCYATSDKSAEDAINEATQALALFLEELRADNNPIQEARRVADIMQDADVKKSINEGGVLVQIPVLVPMGRPVKATISMDAGTLALADSTAKAMGMTRSSLLAEGVRHMVMANSGGSSMAMERQAISGRFVTTRNGKRGATVKATKKRA